MGTPWVSFDGKDCSGCKHLNERGYCEFTACIIPCTVRAIIPEVKPQTNGDSVRSMSDEKLATKLYLFTCVHVFDSKVKCEDNGCKKCWLDWLKERAE